MNARDTPGVAMTQKIIKAKMQTTAPLGRYLAAARSSRSRKNHWTASMATTIPPILAHSFGDNTAESVRRLVKPTTSASASATERARNEIQARDTHANDVIHTVPNHAAERRSGSRLGN